MYALDNYAFGGPIIKEAVITTKKDTCLFQVEFSRPESVKDAWMIFKNEDRKININLDKLGKFQIKLALMEKFNNYDIILEDRDSQLDIVTYSFKIVRTD
jgi:hypothetical protein